MSHGLFDLTHSPSPVTSKQLLIVLTSKSSGGDVLFSAPPGAFRESCTERSA